MKYDRNRALVQSEMDGFPQPRRGKVRDIYDLGESLLFVATDRISAFDCVMPNGIPDKGRVLTQMSLFWFERMKDFLPNHLLTADVSEYPQKLKKYASDLEGRSMLVKKASPLPVECIVRGYITGSGWKDYQKNGAICGIPLRAGYRQAEKLDMPIFTPSTKAELGTHDENISFESAVKLLGTELAETIRDYSLRAYADSARFAESKGIILADTKFEFGIFEGKVILIDEVLTPDSSRFWPADEYRINCSPPSLDKQFVRDYLEGLDWKKTPPAPDLPDDIVFKTKDKYFDAFFRLSGRKIA